MGKRFLKSVQPGVLIGAALLGLVAMGGGKAAPPPVVRVDSGELKGVVDDGVVSYRGIPFAAPPVGDLRWRPPQPMAPWTGVRQATEYGADCMQGRFGPPPSPGAPPAAPPSEDCLFLNVWKPASAAPGAKLPVMVWIYGGGFMGGSSSSPITSGTQFAKTWRHPGRRQLPRRAVRVLRLSRAEPGTSRRAQGQLRLHGPDRGPQVGASGTSPRSEAIRTTSLSLDSPRAVSRCTASWLRQWRVACSRKRSSSLAVRATACSPRGR